MKKQLKEKVIKRKLISEKMKNRDTVSQQNHEMTLEVFKKWGCKCTG